MRALTTTDSSSSLSQKLHGARERIGRIRRTRRLRRGLRRSCLKSQKVAVETIPSPFTDNNQLASTVICKEPGASPRSFSPSLSLLSRSASARRLVAAMDGATDRVFGRPSRTSSGQVAAVFVHAGAGYHSITNEHVHLGACSE